MMLNAGFSIPWAFFPFAVLLISHSHEGRVSRMMLEQLEGAWGRIHWVSTHLPGIWEPCLDPGAFLGTHLPAQLLFPANSSHPVPGSSGARSPSHCSLHGAPWTLPELLH